VNPETAVFVKPHLASAISRDGRWVAVVLPFANDDEAGIHFRVYVRDLERGNHRDWLRLGGEGFALHSPSFTRDSQRLSVLRDTDDGTHVAIFELSKPTGPYRVVSELPGSTLAYKWLGEPHDLCCLGLDPEGIQRLWVWRGIQPTPISPPGQVVLDYTTNGRRLAYIYREDGEEVLAFCDEQGEVVRQVRETRAKGRLCFSPNGDFLAFVGLDSAGDTAAERIFLLDLRDEAASPMVIGAGVEGVITSFDWHRDGYILAAFAVGTRGVIVALRLGEEPEPVASSYRYLSAPSCDRSTGRWTYLAQDSDSPQKMMLQEAERPPVALTFFNDELGPTVPGETVEWESADGERIEGIWLAPEGPGPHPTVVWLHGGPLEHIGHTFSAYFQVLAGAGYAVFAPNYRGSSGRGRAFSQSAIGELGRLDAEDVVTGIRSLQEKGMIHPAKFAFWGWHYGASLALLLCARDGMEAKAVIAGAPFVDWVAAFGSLADPSPMENYFLVEWWRDRKAFDRVSPVTYAGSMSTPVLLLQGRQDRLLPLSQSMLLYRALLAQDVPTDLVYYVNEGHILRGPGAVRDMLRRGLLWLEEHVTDAHLGLC
jgi:acetyl esterase/lipase